VNPQSASETNDWFSTAEYVNALRNLGTRISDKQQAMLKAHAEAPDRTLSVFELAEVVGSDKDNTTYSIYGRLGHMFAAESLLDLAREDRSWPLDGCDMERCDDCD